MVGDGDADNQHVFREGAIHDAAPADSRPLFDPVFEHFGSTAGKILDINSIGNQNDTENILGQQQMMVSISCLLW